MKQLLAIGLFLCLAAPFTGLWSWLHLQKMQVRNQVLQEILKHPEEHELIVLKFTFTEAKTQLRWEHDREFEYKDQMYDVVETSVLGDSIFYLCYADHKETELNSKLRQLASRSSDRDQSDQQQSSRFNHFLKNLCHSTQSCDNALSCLHTSKPDADLQVHYALMNAPPPTPPPEIAVIQGT